MFAIAVKKLWTIHQMDINNAFFHGYLDKELYLSPSQGCKAPHGTVSKLEKALYDLKQAPRQWYKDLYAKLTGFGFKWSKFDHC